MNDNMQSSEIEHKNKQIILISYVKMNLHNIETIILKIDLETKINKYYPAQIHYFFPFNKYKDKN